MHHSTIFDFSSTLQDQNGLRQLRQGSQSEQRCRESKFRALNSGVILLQIFYIKLIKLVYNFSMEQQTRTKQASFSETK